MKTFCTIITADYWPFAKTLYTSLQQENHSVKLQVLVLDETINPPDAGINIHCIDSMENFPFFNEIKKKYAHTGNPNHFRWALKPVFINYLLENNFQKVIYVDPDIFFCGDHSFLFKQLDTAAVLLTPHWREADPIADEENFLTLFKDGLYNAGFIAASTKGKNAINWWAGLCSYKIEKNQSIGMHDDQRYLDAMPIMFSDIEVLKHKGCNLAHWNINVCKRELVNNKLQIDKVYDPIFIHFTKDTIINILNRNDYLLSPYLSEYEKTLKQEGGDVKTWKNGLSSKSFDNLSYKIKHKIRFRTRIKRFFFKLAEKL